MPCDPTLGGGDMDKQCQGSNDLYCSCSGLCLVTDSAIDPTGTTISACDQAKQTVSKYKLDNLKSIDTDSLTVDQRTAIATNQCCKNCGKEDRVSQLGVSVNCADKTISQPTYDSCGLFSPDPLALSHCPTHSSAPSLTMPLLALGVGLFNCFLL